MESSSSSSTLNDNIDPHQQNKKRRNRIGTKNNELYNWEPLQYDQIESNYATQEYIQDTIRKYEKDVNVVLDIPENQDKNVWQYEQIRQFTLELNQFTVLFKDICNQKSCPKMKATDDWLFLCASHKQTQECSAIDYIIHTLDSTSALLNSDKNFPQRIEISQASVKHFPSIMRRLYRIFAHAYYHHRELYDDFEAKTQLCQRFVKFGLSYGLLPKNVLIIK
eukprot:gene9389-11534_t